MVNAVHANNQAIKQSNHFTPCGVYFTSGGKNKVFRLVLISNYRKFKDKSSNLMQFGKDKSLVVSN